LIRRAKDYLDFLDIADFADELDHRRY